MRLQHARAGRSRKGDAPDALRDARCRQSPACGRGRGRAQFAACGARGTRPQRVRRMGCANCGWAVASFVSLGRCCSRLGFPAARMAHPARVRPRDKGSLGAAATSEPRTRRNKKLHRRAGTNPGHRSASALAGLAKHIIPRARPTRRTMRVGRRPTRDSDGGCACVGTARRVALSCIAGTELRSYGVVTELRSNYGVTELQSSYGVTEQVRSCGVTEQVRSYGVAGQLRSN
jgi:hypothetical protein